MTTYEKQIKGMEKACSNSGYIYFSGTFFAIWCIQIALMFKFAVVKLYDYDYYYAEHSYYFYVYIVK